MVDRFLVGFVWLNLQFSVSWMIDFWWGSCGSIFSFLCHGRQTFSGVRVAQSLDVCVMVGRLLVGFVWPNLQFSVSWLEDFWWDSCGSIFSLLCHGRQTFSGVRVTQSLVFCVMVGRLLVGFVSLNLQFSVIVGRLLVGFVWLNIQSSVSWLVDFQWGQCGSIFGFLRHGWKTFSGVRVAQSLLFCHGWQTFSGVHVAQSLVFCVMVGRLLLEFAWLNLLLSVLWLVDFQWDSCGSIFSLLCHGRQTFSGVRVTQSFVFCVMVGRLLVGFVWLNLQFSVSLQVDFQQGSCGSIFSLLCHGWQTFSGVRVAQSFVFCVMVGRLLVVFVWLNLYYSVMVGRLLVGFMWLNLQFSVSWLVDFQWGSCGSIFCFLCHGWQTFSGVRMTQSSFLCHGWQTFNGVRVAQLVFCVMVGRLLVGFVWVNLQFSVSWLVDFQWGSCVSIFSFLCHGRQTFSGVRVVQSLIFRVLVGRLLVGFVLLNLQFSVSWLVDFQWGSCGSIFSFLCHGW